MPSSVTVVPGSHGPRQSGSVTTPTWHASTLASLTSTARHAPGTPSDDVENTADDDDDDEEEDDVGGIGELAASHCNKHNERHSAVWDGRLRPGAATWRTGQNIFVVFDTLYGNTTASTKPEIYTVYTAVPSEQH